MRKLISAVTSLAMAATMVSVIAPTAASAAETKGFAIRTFAEADSPYAASGSTVKISSEDVAKGDVVVPCAVYLNEATPTSQTYSVQLTVKDTNEAAKNIKFDYKSFKKGYFSSEKTYTFGGVTGHTKQPLTFAGKWSTDEADMDGDQSTYFIAHGEHSPTCAEGQRTAGTSNWYMGYVWTCGGFDYEWIGGKSDAHPMFVFDVTIPKGTPDGDYELVYCDYNTDKTGSSYNPSCVIETKEGRCTSKDNTLNLETMKITVGGGSPDPVTTTTTAPTPITTTTTTKPIQDPDPQPSGDISFDFGKWEAKPGDEVKVPVKLNANGNRIISMDVVFKQDSPITMTAIGDTSTCLDRATITKSLDLPGLNFISKDENGDGIIADNGGTVFTLTYHVPENATPGEYKIGFADKAEVFKDNTAWTYDVSSVNGVIKVSGGGTDVTTTTKDDPIVTTTTTKTDDPQPAGDITFDFGKWDAMPGDDVKVPVKLNANGNRIISMDVVFAQDSPITMTAIGDTSTCLDRATITKSLDLPGLNFISKDENGDGIIADNGGTVFTLTYHVPENATPGEYKIGFADKAEVFKDNTAWTYKVSAINGVITVGGGTTTTTTAPITTTTTTTTKPEPQPTTTTTTPDPQPGTKLAPDWGDANCDGNVNVADVVVLNRQLNGTLDLTAQGKVNADVVNPQDASGAAVDPAGVELTMDDSTTIIQYCVHLVEKLPVTK